MVARAVGHAGFIASIGLRLWAKASRRPVDSLSLIGALATSLLIIINAVFLQKGSHPAPFFANPGQANNRSGAAGTSTLRPSETLIPAHSLVGSRTPQAAAVRRNDPIAELIVSSTGSSSRVSAVQRVLSEYGYGQVKPTGVIDTATSAAIETFEREHKLPITGRLSDRLLSELAAMAGHPLD
jgi:hypothetical protein